ncbi:MAG: hypothetical protein ABIG61_10670 [Planctomycetota bacterium]
MDNQAILDELLDLLQKNNVRIRTEALGGSGGGLCTIKGSSVFFLDSQAQTSDIAAICAQAVAKIVDIDAVYIKPQVRQFIENQTSKHT